MEGDGVDAVAGSVVEAPGFFGAPAASPSSELGKDEFLQLLVAQLKYQDPLNPSSSDEFISTTAQFTVVEKLDELTKQGENSALVTSLTTASSLIGREVTANIDGIAVTAVVNQSRIVGGEVALETERGPINLGQIISVGPAPLPVVDAPAPPISPVPVVEAAEPVASDSATGEEAPAEQVEQVDPVEPDPEASSEADVAVQGDGPAPEGSVDSAQGPGDDRVVEAGIEPADDASPAFDPFDAAD